MTPSQAFYVDSKLDDGKPITGIIFGTSNSGPTSMPFDPEHALTIGAIIGQRLNPCIDDDSLSQPSYLLSSAATGCTLAIANKTLRINY